jgi:hypothetical protein
LHRFVEDPSPVIALLEMLRDDPSEMVRRSVANNLNDIAKDHPARVVELCQAWSADATRERTKLIRHALRSLVKGGEPGALEILGFSSDVDVEVSSIEVSPAQVRLGEAVTLKFAVASRVDRPQQLNIDYALHFVKKSGQRAPKVFKLKTMLLGAKQRVEVAKQHPMREVTTRTYYPGRHTIELLVNGKPMGQAEFELLL